MRALCWMGKHDVQVRTVPDPVLLEPTDAIVRVTSAAICGSDLHLYDGVIPQMKEGDILGHEAMGEVVEIGTAVRNLSVGDRVVVPFNIACGECWFCVRELYSLCDRSNPSELTAKLMGEAPGGAYGYSHLLGGYAGGQAELLRVPFADCGPFKVGPALTDEQLLFLSDVFPTGYMAALNCDIHPGDTIAVWGCGPVGQFAIRSAFMLGAGRVIAIDRVPERLAMARDAHAETIDITHAGVYDTLMDLTGGRGPDACLDAVGTEAHSTGSIDAVLDKAKTVVKLATDRAHVFREVMRCCRKGGTLSIAGVYVGLLDKVPFGAAMNKGLTIRTGQTPVRKYAPLLLEKVEAGEIDPSFVVTHRLPLDDGPAAYKMFRDKQDGCIKVVLKP